MEEHIIVYLHAIVNNKLLPAFLLFQICGYSINIHINLPEFDQASDMKLLVGEQKPVSLTQNVIKPALIPC